jgi:D-alanine-D-alanine ligase
VQGALELLGIPYTGSGVMASGDLDRQGDDQARLAGRGHADAALHAAAPRRLPARRSDQDPDDLGLPLIVKPAREGSSIGVAKVQGYSQMQEAVDAPRRSTPTCCASSSSPATR